MIKPILKVLGLTGTVYILEYLDTHSETQYKELNETINTQVLNTRLRQLRQLGLIEHHFVRNEKRREWYTLTQKGKRVLEHTKKLPKLLGLKK